MESGNPLPYVGEQLVSDESFLRRLPIALVASERLRFDAIVTASDIIAQAFSALRQLAIEVGSDVNKLGNPGRAFALSQCWTLVDQLHAIRQLVKPPRGVKSGPFTQALIDQAEPATFLRNRMDHLAENLANLSIKSGPKSPLFGSLSYFYTVDPIPKGGSFVTIMSGALHGDDVFPIINPFGQQIALPVDYFTLAAFGFQLEFGRSIGALRDWLRANEAKIEQKIREQLRSQVTNDEELEKAMAHLGGGLAIVAHIEFVDAGDESSGPSME